MLKIKKMLFFILLATSGLLLADDCDDFINLAGYGIVGDNSFLSGNNSTMNGNEITGDVDDPNTPTPSGNLADVDVDFPAIDPLDFPENNSTNDLTFTASSNSISPGSYDDVEIKKTNGSLSFSQGDYYIRDLEAVQQGTTLYMAPGNYFIENLSLKQGNSIVLQGNGQVKIYIKNTFSSQNQVSLNSDGNVGDLIVYLYDGASFTVGEGDNGQSADKMDFKGILYTPYVDTTIEFGNNNDIEGAIFSAGDVEVENNTDFFYTSQTEADVIAALGCGGGGDDDPVAGEGFNCIHTAEVDAANGRLYTRIAGNAFTFDIAALDASGNLDTQYKNIQDQHVTLQLVKDDCSTPLDTPVTETVTFPANQHGRIASPSITVNKAYSAVRCLLIDSEDPATAHCSSDSFSIRPPGFDLDITDHAPASPDGTVLAVAGATRPMQITTTEGYDLTPEVAGIQDHDGDNARAKLSIHFISPVIQGGNVVAISDTYTYDEVGYFYIAENSISDSSFTSVDATAGDCIDDNYSNSLVNGKVGCDFGNAQDYWVGRFIPSRFTVTVDEEGMIGASCSTFSYAGETLDFTDNPAITIAAVNLNGDVTAKYTGSYSKLTAADVIVDDIDYDATQLDADNDVAKVQVDFSGSPGLTSHNDGTFNWILDAQVLYETNALDVVAPFSADINIVIAEILDSDNVQAVPASHTLQPVGVEIRHGRVSVENAFGSELEPLLLPVTVQHWAGSYFVTNTADNCTDLTAISLAVVDPGDENLVVNDTCIFDTNVFTGAGPGAGACPGATDTALNIESPVSAGDLNLHFQAPEKSGVIGVEINVPAHLKVGGTNPTGSLTWGIHQGPGQIIFMKEVR